MMRTDLEALEDYDEITLYPLPNNPLHKKPVKAVYFSGLFYCHKPEDGPDYYVRDVLRFNRGFTRP